MLTDCNRWTKRVAAAATLMALPTAVFVMSLGSAASPTIQAQKAERVPSFEFDPTWPRMPLPNDWIVGSVIGVAVDRRDHVWILHRPGTLTAGERAAAADPPAARCCKPAPPVVEFDTDGRIVQAWGGATAGTPWPSEGQAGPTSSGEHGLSVDDRGNVWVGSVNDSRLLKFAPDGKFLLQIGQGGRHPANSHDQALLGGPMGDVDPKTNEVYVADGYWNRRVIVFDADTGAFKRQWGAYGKEPDDAAKAEFTADGPPPPHFNVVTCVRISRVDDRVYVCDRTNHRIQVFKKDGTFVNEVVIEPRARQGTVHDLALSTDPEQRFIYVPDPRNSKVWILRRSDLQIVGSFGFAGHFGGGFTSASMVAVDSKGNVYVGEGLEGKRVQRFLRR